MRQAGGHDAASPDTETWIVIECKWFGAARTPREIANWLQDFHGHDGDKLHKHLRRYAWIVANIEKVMNSLGLTRPQHIQSRVVTTLPVPLAFTMDLSPDTEVWTKRELPVRLQCNPGMVCQV
jgi:hypothetical protein